MISEEFEKSGNWLFRWRSYVPLPVIPFLLFALKDSGFLEKHFGDIVETFWEVLCITVSFTGLLVRCLTLGWVPEGTSGRNTQGQLANALNTTGMYSVTRHPLYFGNFLMVMGFILFIEVGWFIFIFLLLFIIFYERIMFAEEAFLRQKFGNRFLEWAAVTPVFLPDFRKWKRSTHSFSWKMILKREYSGFLGIIVAFVALKFSAELLGEHEFEFRRFWFLALGLGLVVYGVLRTLRKKTDFFKLKEP